MQLSHIPLIGSSYDQKNIASSAKLEIVKGENKEKKNPKGTSKRMREDQSYISGGPETLSRVWDWIGILYERNFELRTVGCDKQSTCTNIMAFS